MRTSDFDYELPAELIAQRPLATRSGSRLLYLAADAMPVDTQFARLPSLLREGDLLVFNNTRVFPARLFGKKTSGGRIEILIERLLGDSQVLAHVRASKSPKAGARIELEDGTAVTMLERRDELFKLQFEIQCDLFKYLEHAGQLPLPPYIERAPEKLDHERYQTVYAERVGAIAAPTAGLHFDHDVLASLNEQGIKQCFITLHVGAGTFQPVRSELIEDHAMHAEWAEVSESVCELIRDTRQQGGRIVAVGTTVIRSLEAAVMNGKLIPFSGNTQLFITPGFTFNVVDVLITNFHLPRSSLLMLVSAFAGHQRVMQAYQHAVGQRYRFFSYGDAMLIEKQK
ncbi:MAG: tRNA preQ1(34) S-adenosylmethionine ribosyltransferase-isomerase QueA [Gammaproteobacteria bacterium]|nr:tRNA preQ1(34) S-adenosylmethionine ribosyltransferase-isomerase QueA [Gammaproteobacteria bacterium]